MDDMCRKDDDRLNLLPNDVLIIILSWLPTKSAIYTSVLSKSWRHLWTQMTTLRFNSIEFSTNMRSCSFLNTLRQISWQKIHSLELTLATSISERYMDTMVDVMLRVAQNVKELSLKIETDGKLIYLPTCVFVKQSLEALQIDGFMIRNLGPYLSLPKLRKLAINLRNSDLKWLQLVLYRCPLLEILRVGVNAKEKLTNQIEIESQNLKWLSLSFIGTHEEVSEFKEKVTIDTPKLEFLEVNSPVMLRFCFPKTPSRLSRAKLSMGEYESSTLPWERVQNPKEILRLLNPISQVKTLSLSGDHILFPVSYIDENKVEMFRQLTRLEIKLGSRHDYDNFCSVVGARKFLKLCPNLNSLVLTRKRHTLFEVKWLLSFMLETDDLESTSSCVSDSSEVVDMKLIGDFNRVKKDGKILVEIKIHVYQNVDQLIYYAKGFALPNQLWDCDDFLVFKWILSK